MENKFTLHIPSLFSLVFRICIYGSYTILVHLCEVDGKVPFSSASTVFTTELLKVRFECFHYV